MGIIGLSPQPGGPHRTGTSEETRLAVEREDARAGSRAEVWEAAGRFFVRGYDPDTAVALAAGWVANFYVIEPDALELHERAAQIFGSPFCTHSSIERNAVQT